MRRLFFALLLLATLPAMAQYSKVDTLSVSKGQYILQNKDTVRFKIYTTVTTQILQIYNTGLQVDTAKYVSTEVPPKDTTTTPPATNYGTLTYKAGYNTASEINTYQGMYNSVSTVQKTEGAGSFRSEVRGSQASESAGYRSEMEYNQAAVNFTEGVLEYDVFYENWRAVSGGGHSIQWHPNSSSGSAILSLQNYGGKFNVVRSLGGTNYYHDTKYPGQTATPAIATQPNKWYRMRWEIRWSTKTDGYIRLYIDNQLYYSFVGITSGGGQYLKVGQNRWSMSSTQNTIVYYDNLKVYTKIP